MTKRPDVEYWGTDLQAIVIALEVEKKFYKHLQELKSLSSKNSESDFLEFMKKLLGKQKRNIRYLQYQHSYQEALERLTGKDAHLNGLWKHGAKRLQHLKVTREVFHCSSSQRQLLKNLDL